MCMPPETDATALRRRVHLRSALAAICIAIAYAAAGLLASPAQASVRATAPSFAQFGVRSINGACYMELRGVVRCEAFAPRLDGTATLTARGAVAICAEPGPQFPLRCPVFQPSNGAHGPWPDYRPNRIVTVGGFRCEVLKAGVKCVVVRTGKGFLITATRIVRLGTPAPRPRPGTIAIRITGIPRGHHATLTVIGAHTRIRVTATRSVRVAAGRYTLIAGRLSVAGHVYVAAGSRRVVLVRAGHGVGERFAYRRG